MANNEELNEFATQLRQEIIAIVEAEGNDRLYPEAFTQYVIDYLVDAGELEDGTECHYKTIGLEVSGYNLDEDGTLNLFTTIYTQSNSPETVGKGSIEAAFKRLRNFLQKALNRYYVELEESSEAFDMAEHIFESQGGITSIGLYLFTDGLATIDIIPDEKLNELPISYHVWDLRRLQRHDSSGKQQEPIHIDFPEPLPCLQSIDDTADYSAYLTIIPGDILNELYDLYGSRLLELNVRSYLQAKAKVNQGIRRTIINEPARFLAYNNGISATASNIEVVTLQGGGLGIKSLDNLQIVNGGQTTASIFYTAHKDKADVSRLRVQAKISVVAAHENIDNLVSLISRYANSQNKVSEADFSANEPFHVELEKLSRSIWAPAIAGTQRQTRWFYERARGQYQDAIAHAGTPASQRQFKETHPSTQKFTKTDLAKFIMTWKQYPHIVSQGAQKCFTQFTTQLKEIEETEVNQSYFHHLVAKAILFRQAEKIVALQKFGGYRANIVTYSLAYIVYHTNGQANLDRIWQQQKIGPGLQEAIEQISPQVHKIITSPPGGKNVTEWCKRLECWNRVRDIKIDLPTSLNDELLHTSSTKDPTDNSESPNSLIGQVMIIPAETWYQLVSWGKETHNLQAPQRNVASKLYQVRKSGKQPSRKLAEQGLLLFKQASRLGFRTEPIAI